MTRFTSKDLLKFIKLHAACDLGLKRVKRYLAKHTAREALAEYRRCRKVTEIRYNKEKKQPEQQGLERTVITWAEYDRAADFAWLCRALDLGESIKDSWGYEIEFFCSHVTVEQIARAIKRELRVD